MPRRNNNTEHIQESKKYSIQNRRYLGNKYKLLTFIRETIDRECGEYSSLFDVFAGTGVVASGFLDKKIITNDLLYSNYISHIAWFENLPFSKKLLNQLIEHYNSLAVDEDNYMSLNFSDTFFSRAVCRKIGYIREDIEQRYKAGSINKKEYAILITSLLYSMDKIAKTCGHYDAYRHGVDFEEDFQMVMLDIPKKTSKRNEFYNCDSNALVKNVKCDVAYLDPPYNSRQYGDLYHLLENVAKWEKPDVFGVARKMNRDHIKSDYCLSSATEAFEDLVNHLNCKYIVLSYNNTGDSADGRSNARISDTDIMRILSKKGEVKVFTKKYKAFTTGKSKNNKNEERLFVCTVNKHPSIQKSPLNYTGGKGKLLPQILPLFPNNIECFVDMFCGGCNVGINVKAKKYIFNDKNETIISMYEYMKNNKDEFVKYVLEIIDRYQLSDSNANGYEFYGCESASGLGSYNQKPFEQLRADFNSRTTKDIEYYAMFYTLIVFSFNNQIRFNASGHFNLPVGKRDFNKNMQSKLNNFIQVISQQDNLFTSDDFADVDIPDGAFVYCDPPYLITTASYNENSGWTEDHERRLLAVLNELSARGIKFAMSNVLEHNGRKNQILIDWAQQSNVIVTHLNFHYNNSNYQSKCRNSKTDEVLITNYSLV